MPSRWILALSLLVAGCGEWAAFSDQTAESLAYPRLGGEAYVPFRIAPELPAADRPRAAVKLTYLMTDEVIERNAVSQSDQSLRMLQMLDDLPQPKTHHLVFRDGDQRDDSRLFYLQGADNSPATIRAPQSTLAPGVGEVQSNNPKVLAQVLGWTLDQYPGRYKYLQVYTHGGGVRGIGTDDNQTNPAGQLLPDNLTRSLLRPQSFAEGLRQGLKGRMLDVIYFQSCLMGNVEALYELRGLTRYAVASERVSFRTDNAGLTMTRLFGELAERNVQPADVAKALAIQAHASNGQLPDGSSSGFKTVVAADIGRFDELKSALNRLALALMAAMPSESESILRAYDQTVQVEDGEPVRDLWDFTAELQKSGVRSASVQAAIAQVRAAQTAAMHHERDNSRYLNGLSIFMPDRFAKRTWDWYLESHYARTRFAADTVWDDFIRLVLRQPAQLRLF